MTTPYDAQPKKAFWRAAVAERPPMAMEDLYAKKFELKKDMEIATAGSCFAQHVARALRKSGFNVLDLEPAPYMLPQEDWARFGFGLYSARYGNVYTVRQMVQLFERAFGLYTPAEEAWATETGFYDPFRPTIEPEGFASLAELKEQQAQHLEKVRDLFARARVLVFTLGLTEAWRSKADGAVYPSCPGALAGEFDPEKYEFVNFRFADIVADLAKLIAYARGKNPRVKFLFTVSPVPLAATATDQHVLVATTYSKAVLRAAVGQITQQYPFADYFPSFEIISTPPFKGGFFEPNMRAVTQTGVDFVMGHFLRAHGVDPDAFAEQSETQQWQPESDVWCDDDKIDELYA